MDKYIILLLIIYVIYNEFWYKKRLMPRGFFFRLKQQDQRIEKLGEIMHKFWLDSNMYYEPEFEFPVTAPSLYMSTSKVCRMLIDYFDLKICHRNNVVLLEKVKRGD